MTRPRIPITLVLALSFGCAHHASAGMPRELFVGNESNGGNCAYLTSIDERGSVTGSEGCETRARNTPSRVLTPERRAALVAALDRLRDSAVWAKGTAERRCHGGLFVRLTERSGATRMWTYCEDPRTGEYPKPPKELADVLRALGD